MKSGRSWSYEEQVERRREGRLKGPQLYNLTKLEEDTRHLEWKRLEYMHEAAEYSEMFVRYSRRRDVFEFRSHLGPE